MQNQMVILLGVLEVKFTKYCTCAQGDPGEDGEYSRECTGFSIIVELELYMLKAYLGKKPIKTMSLHFPSYIPSFVIIILRIVPVSRAVPRAEKL